MGELELQTARLTLTLRGRALGGGRISPSQRACWANSHRGIPKFSIWIEWLCGILRNHVLCVLLFPPLELEAND